MAQALGGITTYVTSTRARAGQTVLLSGILHLRYKLRKVEKQCPRLASEVLSEAEAHETVFLSLKLYFCILACWVLTAAGVS